MKLCTFQGTFNPFHKAHEAMAKHVLDNFCYDKILLIPAFCPPHKQDKRFNSQLRFDMTKAYVNKHKEFEISDIEFMRDEPSYTYITINQLYKLYNIDGKIGFIIGEDSFLQIETWYEADKLKELIDFIVFPRSSIFDNEKFLFLKEKGYHYKIAKHQSILISSTEIRDKIKQQKNTQCVANLIPIEIKEYIEKNGLYI